MATAIHLELRVQDLARAQAFYGRVFDGLAQGDGTFSLFNASGLQLLLLVGEVRQPVRFGFQVEPEQLPLWRGGLSQRGIDFEERGFDHPVLGLRETALLITDPDGHRCSFYALE